MNEQDFRTITREMLCDTWGEKSYPPAVLGKLWRMVKDIQGSDLRAGLDQLSMTVTRAPNLGQIRASCLPAIQRALDARRQEKLKALGAVGCLYCGGSGWIIAISFDDPTLEVGFICTKCEAAAVRGIQRQAGAKEARYWDDDLKDAYFLRRFTHEDALKATELERGARKALYTRVPKSNPAEIQTAVTAIAETIAAGEPMDFGDEPF